MTRAIKKCFSLILLLSVGCILPEKCLGDLDKLSLSNPVVAPVSMTANHEPPKKISPPLLSSTRGGTGRKCVEFTEMQANSRQKLIFVDKNAQPGGDGSTWDRAFNRIRLALDQAFVANEVGLARGVPPEKIYIFIAGGVYSISSERNDKRLQSSIISFDGLRPEIYKNISILGGYRPHDRCFDREKNLNDSEKMLPNPLRTTILDGENKSIHVVEIAGGSENIALKNLTVSNGHAPSDRANDNQSYGGAMLVRGAKNIELDNIAVESSKAHWGGGIAVINSENVSLSSISALHCESVESGGGIYVSRVVRLKLIDSSLGANLTTNQGGGMALVESSLIYFERATFHFNKAREGGGMYIKSITWPADVPVSEKEFKRLSFMNNFASQDGACLSIVETPGVIIAGSTFVNNGFEVDLPPAGKNDLWVYKDFPGGRAVTRRGGAIYYNSDSLAGGSDPESRLVIKEWGDTAKRAAFKGNHAYIGGALYTENTFDLRLSGVKFEENYAQTDGGAVYADVAQYPRAANADFIDGGIIQARDGTIFTRNVAGTDGGGLFFNLGLRELNLAPGVVEFTKNQAGVAGGAIRGSFTAPLFLISRFALPSTAQENQAPLGPDYYFDPAPRSTLLR